MTRLILAQLNPLAVNLIYTIVRTQGIIVIGNVVSAPPTPVVEAVFLLPVSMPETESGLLCKGDVHV